MIREIELLTVDTVYNEPFPGAKDLGDGSSRLTAISVEPAKTEKIYRSCQQNGYTQLLIITAAFLVVGFCFLTWHYIKTDDLCRNPVDIDSSILNKEDVIDRRMDPCHDFYSFACGRWNSSTAKEYNYMSVVEETEVRNLLRLESFLKCPSIENRSGWSSFIKKTFDLCEGEKYTPIKKSKTVAFVKSVAAPLLQDMTEQTSLTDVLRGTYHKLLQTGLFSWDITLDLKDGNIIQALRIAPPKTPWNSDLSFTSRYHLVEYVKEVLLFLGADESSVNSKCEGIADVMLTMKSQLNKTSAKSRPSYLTRRRLNYGEFIKEFDFIDFHQYFDDVSLSDTDFVVVEEGEYFKWLRNYLETSKKKNYLAIHHYLIWSAIDFFVPHLPDEFARARNKYAFKLGSKAKDIVEDSHVCVNAIRKGMNFAASSFFMDKLIDEDSRAMLNDIVFHVKKSFRDFLHSMQSSHPDEGNWPHGLEDVFKNVEIGVPTHLRKIYEEDPPLVKDDSFPSYYLSAVSFVKTKMLKYKREVPLGVLFLPDFLQLNGIFISLPLLVINMGILSPPLFDPNQLLAFNYAGLGFVFAHELAHSTDHLAGNSSFIKKHLKSKTECLQKQYADAKRVIDVRQEDFADNVGIQLAYKAYLEHVAGYYSNGNATLSDRKMFFLHYGQILCEDGSSFSVNHNAYHSPYKFRVNMPLSNFPAFSDTFSCPKGSAMNPDKKCLV